MFANVLSIVTDGGNETFEATDKWLFVGLKHSIFRPHTKIHFWFLARGSVNEEGWGETGHRMGRNGLDLFVYNVM